MRHVHLSPCRRQRTRRNLRRCLRSQTLDSRLLSAAVPPWQPKPPGGGECLALRWVAPPLGDSSLVSLVGLRLLTSPPAVVLAVSFASVLARATRACRVSVAARPDSFVLPRHSRSSRSTGASSSSISLAIAHHHDTVASDAQLHPLPGSALPAARRLDRYRSFLRSALSTLWTRPLSSAPSG